MDPLKFLVQIYLDIDRIDNSKLKATVDLSSKEAGLMDLITNDTNFGYSTILAAICSGLAGTINEMERAGIATKQDLYYQVCKQIHVFMGGVSSSESSIIGDPNKN